MKLTVFKYGSTHITERMAFQDGSENIKLPIGLLFFLIEQNDRKILIDVGCDTMPGFELTEFEKPVRVLEKCGINPKSITDIILTHTHHDHIDAARYYTQAAVYLHKSELEFSKPYLEGFKNIHPLDGDTLIFENVLFKHIGGHSPGSGIVLINALGKTYVLCGDECYTKANLLTKQPTGSSFCLEKSRFFVSEYSKEPYAPILFHDPDLLKDIGSKTLFDC